MKHTAAWSVIRHATPMMLAQVIPLAASFVVVALALGLGRADFVTVIGITATIAGLGTLITVGVGVATLRELAPARDDPEQTARILSRNLGIASAVSFIVLAVSAVVALALWLALPPDSVARPAVWIAFVLQAPALVVAPQTSVLFAAFQHLGRERDNLSITLTRTSVALVIGIAVVLFVSEPTLAIGLQSAVGTLMATAVLIALRRRLARSDIHVRLFHAPVFSAQALVVRIMNSLDGAVFMILFLVAQLIAAGISLEVAAKVAGGVAFCRTVIVPLKTIGQTAGRLGLRADDRRRFARASSVATGVFVIPVAVALAGAALLGFSPFGSTLLSVLIAAQLLVEPFAGSLFSYLKIAVGPKSGLMGLLLTYLVLAPVLLIACSIVAPSAEALWVCLLFVRFCFSATTLRALNRDLSRPHPQR